LLIPFKLINYQPEKKGFMFLNRKSKIRVVQKRDKKLLGKVGLNKRIAKHTMNYRLCSPRGFRREDWCVQSTLNTNLPKENLFHKILNMCVKNKRESKQEKQLLKMNDKLLATEQ
jgi:hypothetical protein